MTTRTGHKLGEAKYFLEQMKRTHFDIAYHLADESPPTPVFIYYLSAFVSAARSVTWIMRSEYGAVPGWKLWYEQEEQLDEERELLDAFSAFRNRNEKQGILDARWSPTYTPVPKDIQPAHSADSSAKPQYQLTLTKIDCVDADSSDLVMLSYVDHIRWESRLLGDKDLVASCDRYYRMLDLLVRKCEKQFEAAE